MGKKFWRKNIIIKRFFKKSSKPVPSIKSTPNTRPIGWSIPSYPNKNTNKNTNMPTDNISMTILSEPDYYYYYSEEYVVNIIYPINYPNDNFDKFLEAGSDSKSSN